MSKEYHLIREDWGFACAIAERKSRKTKGGRKITSRWVIHLNVGTKRNEENAERIVDELNAGQRAADACRKALALIERCKLDADHPECIGTFEVVEEIEKLAKAVVGEEDA